MTEATQIATVVGGGVVLLVVVKWVLVDLMTRWSKKVDPAICAKTHETVERRLTDGDLKFDSIMVELRGIRGETAGQRANQAMAWVTVCMALNNLLPSDQRIDCRDLVDGLKQ